jgi:hypothetical protein
MSGTPSNVVAFKQEARKSMLYESGPDSPGGKGIRDIASFILATTGHEEAVSEIILNSERATKRDPGTAKFQLTQATILSQQRDLVPRADGSLYQHGSIDPGLALMRLRDRS